MNNLKNKQLVTQTHSEDSLKQLVKGLKELNRPVKKADLLLQTGLTVNVLEDGLETLMERYPCRLQVNEEGEILYKFDFKAAIPVKKDWKYWLAKAKTKGKALLKGGFKVWIAGMLLGYFWMYFPILPFALFQVGTVSIPIIFTLLLVILFPALGIYAIGHTFVTLFTKKKKKETPKGLTLSRLLSGNRLFYTDKSSFNWNPVKATYHYVFGETPPSIDPLMLEKQVLNYVYHHNLQITVSELISITGWSVYKAETEMTKLLVNYDGTVDVNQEGVIIYSFPKLEEPALSYEKEKSFIWKNPLKLHSFNQNFSYENTLITGFNLFIMVFSGAMWSLGVKIPASWFPDFFSISGLLNIHWLPFSYSVVLLGTSLVNKLRHELLINKEKENVNAYYQLLSRVFEHPEGISLERKHPHYQKLIKALEGEEDVNDQGEIMVKFPYLMRERKFALAAQQLTYEQQAEMLPQLWEFRKEFGAGALEQVDEHILIEEQEDELVVYIKLIEKNGSVKAIGLGLLVLFCFIGGVWMLGNMPLAVVLFLLIPFGILSSIFLNYLHKILNTSILKINKKGVEVKQLPFKWLGKNKKYSFKEFKYMTVKQQSGTTYQLCLHQNGKKFPLVLAENIENKWMLWDIQKRVREFLGKMR